MARRLQDIVNDIATTEAQIRAEQSRHQATIQALNQTLAAYKAEQTLVRSGLDVTKLSRAETVIYFRGNPARDKEGCLSDAIKDLAAGAPKMRSLYFGVKDYDRWSGQRCDLEYGYVPRHGYIVFEIGLQLEPRKRLVAGGALTSEEIDAAIYYLMNLAEVHRARAKATAVEGAA